MEKVLVIAAARKEFVNACLNELGAENTVCLWLNESSWGEFMDLDANKLCYGESLGLPTVSMWLNFFRFRPTRVVMVCGTTYYHENIYSVVSFLQKMTGNSCTVEHYSLNQFNELSDAKSGGPGAYSMGMFWGLVAVLLALCGYLAYLFPLGVVALLLCLVGYEVLAKPRGIGKGAQSPPIVDRDMVFEPMRDSDGVVKYHGRVTRADQDEEIEFVETAAKYDWFEHGSRIVSDQPMDVSKPRILLLGCSVMYGLNVDDSQTCGWLLQERFPDYSIINGARSASSPFEMLHFLKESIEDIKPEIVLFGFWDGLEARNARLGKLSCMVKGESFEKGFGLIEQGTIVPQPNFPGAKQWNDSRIAKNEAAFKGVMRETQEGVFMGFRQLCEKHGAQFAVAALNNSPMYHGFLHIRRFNWCLADIDWSKDKEKWTLAPLDSHPNAASNAVYADVIEMAIRDLLEGGSCTPDLSKICIRDTGTCGSDDQFIYPHY